MSVDEQAYRDNPTRQKRRPTSYDVARAAGVAQSTVSRCFQENTNISSETRDHVLKVAADLGYTPNSLARSLITQRSNMVGVIATKFTMRNNPELVYAIADALKRHKIGLLLMVIEDDAAIGSTLREALEYPLDGLISCALMERKDVDRFIKHGMPVLFFNRRMKVPRVDSIGTDQSAGAIEVADALFAAGHRRILCIGGPEQAPVSRERAQGLINRLNALGIEEVDIVSGNFSYASGRSVFLETVASGKKPDAVFCANDQLALGVLDACRYDLGWKVPDDISVIGFDDIAESGRPSYALTTIQQQVEPMAEKAVDLLIQRIANPTAPARNLLIKGKLIRRGSARLA